MSVDGGVEHAYPTQLHSSTNTDFDTIKLLEGIEPTTNTAYRYNNDLILDLTIHSGTPDKSSLLFLENGLQIRDYTNFIN